MMQSTTGTALGREAAEAPAAARRHIQRNRAAFAELGARLRAAPPRFVTTCARGSSDHAAVYGKYLIETALGHPVASVGPSVASVYGTRLDLRDSLFIAVSQSGRSPDLLRLAEAAKAGGAVTVGFVNDEASPLMALCDVALPLCAGPETSVAATKSYLLSCLAFLNLTAHWSGSAELLEAAESVPDALERALGLDWWPALETLVPARGLFVIGRGTSYGAALEMALKFKETSRLHAEAFSAAEVIHGPLALVGPDLPVLAVGQEDEAAGSIRQAAERIAALGSPVWSALDGAGTTRLPTVAGLHPTVAPLCQIQSFYMAVHRLAVARGYDPDAPANLRKVTETR